MTRIAATLALSAVIFTMGCHHHKKPEAPVEPVAPAPVTEPAAPAAPVEPTPVQGPSN